MITFQQKSLKTLQDIDISGKSVLVRVDLNAPIKDGSVTDDTRIAAILPTLRYLIDHKARPTLISHLGRPDGKKNPKYSLLPVAERLAELLGKEVLLPDDCLGSGVNKLIQDQLAGQVILLENLRYYSEEEKNDLEFAKTLKHHHQVFVSDAFGVLHRAHASTSALPSLFPERCVGFLVQKEIEFLYPLLKAPQKPYSVVLGGAKISDKIKVLESLLKKVDRLFIGGAMVFTFLKAKGVEIGRSLHEENMLHRAKRIMEEAKERNVSIFFPKDFVIARSMQDHADYRTTESLAIPDGWMALDVGPKTVEHFREFLSDSKTIFWNGPMGWFEQPPFDQGTYQLAAFVAEIQGTKIVGGGDSVAAVTAANLADKMTHISTGGGATLEFLENPMLPGLKSMLA